MLFRSASNSNAVDNHRLHPLLQHHQEVFQNRTDLPDQLRASINPGQPGRLTQCLLFLRNLRRRTGDPGMGALAQHRPPTRLPQCSTASRVRGRVLRCQHRQQRTARNQIARASIRPRATNYASKPGGSSPITPYLCRVLERASEVLTATASSA